MSNCGPGNQSCCTSLVVPKATFYRSYDDVTYTSQAAPATVSGFRLDKYEVTVGRFRQFVTAVVAGWLPTAASGRHTHLNMGQGLSGDGPTTSYETGWDPSWNVNLATDAGVWTANLECDANHQTWTASPASNENRPINCETWFEAYAFCIWDGGFLPSEAEWNVAAAGGSEQRAYPWSVPSTVVTIDCSYANYHGGSGGSDYCVAPGTGSTNDVGTESTTGDGRWGHSDLAGNAAEWVLDWDATYVVPCVDCAELSSGTDRVIRGGDFGATAMAELASFRGSNGPTDRYSGYVGVRCARTP